MSGPIERFRDVYGDDPEVRVCVPGRVNLIGEHIDYNQLPVLPMAVQRALVLVARGRADSTVRVANEDPRFHDLRFDLAGPITAEGSGAWGDYVRAGCRAWTEQEEGLAGYDALVRSDLPVGAGLSSSSALVVAAGLALAEVNALAEPTMALAERMAQAERFVGTSGGSMDQAICLGARAGHVCRIEFAPLRITPVPVPSEWRFLVASSLARAEKSGPAQAAYNRRTLECADAQERMCLALGLPPESGYRGLLATFPQEQLLGEGQGTLPETLFRRFRHVVTEAGRVRAAETALVTGDIEGMGHLMVASHQSLREDYEVSSPELDQLVSLAVDAGAPGARLTGAGFGGCIVALVDATSVDRVRAELQRGFYSPRGVSAGSDDHVFEAVPSAGASVTALPRR